MREMKKHRGTILDEDSRDRPARPRSGPHLTGNLAVRTAVRFVTYYKQKTLAVVRTEIPIVPVSSHLLSDSSSSPVLHPSSIISFVILMRSTSLCNSESVQVREEEQDGLSSHGRHRCFFHHIATSRGVLSIDVQSEHRRCPSSR